MAGQNKVAKEELARRIRAVQDLLLDDYPTADILNHCVKVYAIEMRQAYRYVWAARKFFIAKNKTDVEEKAAYYIERKRKLLREMSPEEKKTPAGVTAANKVLDSMAKIDGVLNPTIKFIGDPKHPIAIQSSPLSSFIDYSKLSTEFLKQLWEIRPAANA